MLNLCLVFGDSIHAPNGEWSCKSTLFGVARPLVLIADGILARNCCARNALHKVFCFSVGAGRAGQSNVEFRKFLSANSG